MITADPGRTDAAKRQVPVADLHDRVIDRAGAKRQGREDFLFDGLVFGKQIQGQRFLFATQGGDDLLDRLKTQDRQQRPKDLFAHDGVVPADLIQQGRRQIEVVLVGLVAVDDLGGIDQASQTIEMTLMDDLSETGLIDLHRVDDLFELLDESILDGLLDVDVIGSDTGLSRIDEFPEGDAPCRKSQVRACFDDGGTLASKL